MSLNIKSKEAYDLANELARLTGQSMAAVVLDALRKQRKQLQLQQKTETKVNELRAIAKRCAAHIRKPVSALEHGNMLYDENGMPR